MSHSIKIGLGLLLLGFLGLGGYRLSAKVMDLIGKYTTISVPSLSGAKAPTYPSRLPNFSHIFIIIFENKDQASIVGSPEARYLNQLAAEYARATNFYATRKPSLPNYLALTGGDTFNITSDCTACFVAADSIVTEIEASGRSWKAYMEDMPKPCFVGDAPPLYRQKHNPFIY